MEAKLIKDHDDYHLVNNEQFVIGTTDESILSCTDKYKLSLKNCQAIERGYDLDELAKKACPDVISSAHSAYKAGFQKALEILGNKKFSEDDVKKAMDITINYELKRDTQSYQEKIDFLKSLQQAEWDVDIVTTTIMENGKCGLDVPIIKPKFDSNNCLILKRK